MEEVLVNELGHDGIRRLIIIGDHPDQLNDFHAAVPDDARGKVTKDISEDRSLGVFQLELKWPVFEPFEIAIESPKKYRRVMMVHFSYADRVSDCIKLAVDAFCAGTGHFPAYAFVREIPKGAEDWIVVHHVQLIQSEIVPANTVAIGGME